MSLQIIGAGFGRTGTKSLQLALETLGYGKCYHMEALLRNPEGVKHWADAYNESSVNWNALFQGYNSIVDFPGSMYYKELHNYYPEAKVILSVRDPESWYQSALKTIYAFDPGPAIKIKLLLKMPFSSTARNLFKVIQLNDKSIWKKFFEGKFEDKAYAINKFNTHIEEVKQTIPENQLLIFEAKDGWQPLCEFLNKPIPETPYPRSNKGENFHEWATGIVKDVLK
jgi:hypothetical protein